MQQNYPMSSTPHTTLTLIDPARHMDRWYSITIQPTLLEPAQATAARIVRGKVRRGYRAGLEWARYPWWCRKTGIII